MTALKLDNFFRWINLRAWRVTFSWVTRLPKWLSTLANQCKYVDRISLPYLKPIAACQTKANNRKKTGIIGNTSTIGLKAIYASGKRANTKVSIIEYIF